MADETERAPGWDAITDEFERVYPAGNPVLIREIA